MAEDKKGDTNGAVKVAFRLLTVSLAVGVVIWFVMMAVGMIAAFPWGLLGLVPLVGIGILLWVVVKERLDNQDDDYYSKNVDE